MYLLPDGYFLEEPILHDVTPLGQQCLRCLVSGIIKDWMEDYFKEQLTRKNDTIPNMMLSALSGTKYYC